ncbi:MAG: ABC transporter ATP-binding protein [Myxococcota bacterium]|nr:ABC transporter ATP-binding protein [Myxococcota bacterium]
MIHVENLTKRYAATTAVDGISFDVAKNEVLGFLGPNGAGKSTTLRILTGFLSASSGVVKVDGHDVFDEPATVKRTIGYLPENVPLYPEMRVSEYLSYRAAIKGVPRSSRRKSVATAMERCLVADVAQRIIGQLSKGYRQRVGLADALVADPKILVLDEPTIGLDPNQIRQVRDLVRELGQERTVVLSSHILPEVEAVCTRVVIINKGRIVGDGNPAQLRASFGDKQGISLDVELLGSQDKASLALQRVEGIRAVQFVRTEEDTVARFTITAEPGYGVRERIFDAAATSGLKLLGLSSRSMSLEDVFVHITTEEVHHSEPDGGQA